MQRPASHPRRRWRKLYYNSQYLNTVRDSPIPDLGASLMLYHAHSVDVCHVGGLSEIQRDFFNKHRDYFKGKVFTAHGYQIFESGAIRHGKFKSFRTDKEPSYCDFSQIPIHSRGKTH